MTPVNQEFLNDVAAGVHGDCQRAVIASLLNLPIAEVPHFLKLANGDATEFWERIQTFLHSHGYVYLTVTKPAGSAFFGSPKPVYHEISGPSPRGNGLFHAVVGCDGQIVFDPHPSRGGLAGDPSEWHYAYLVRAGE